MSWMLALALASAAASRVDAGVCQSRPSGKHWYAILMSTTNQAAHGSAVRMKTTALKEGAPGTDFVDHEMWYGVVGTCKFWVEVGVTDGVKSAGGAVNQHVFWADNRNGGGYHEHYPAQNWDLDTYYQLKVVFAGNESWDVSFAGNVLGTSTSNPSGSGRCLEAGIESTRASSDDHVSGHLTDWQRKDGSDNWSSDWDGATTLSYCPADIDNNSGTTTEVLHGPN